MASERFVDDIAELSIERCLMSSISALFSRDLVDELQDEEIHEMSKESPESANERERCTTKLDVLRTGMNDLKRLDRHQKSAEGMTPSSTGVSKYNTSVLRKYGIQG